MSHPSSLKEQNIYAYNILKASKSHLDQDYSFLFSALLHLESELEYGNAEVSDFAEKLLNIINSNGAFRQIDRVCLAITHPGSSRISVLSSFNTKSLGENAMDPSYSCFVSTSSSLFKTKKSNIRVYSDIADIIKMYDGRPVQRSLKKLEGMGVKSGVTIPLSISNLVSGLLFLNSTRIGEFDHFKAEDFSFLCLLKMVALSALNKSLFGVSGLDSRIGKTLAESQQSTNTFSTEEFKNRIHTAIQRRFSKEISIKIEDRTGKKFFYAMNPAIYTLIKTLECLNPLPNEIHATFSLENHEGKDFVNLTLHPVSLTIEQLAFLQDLKLFSANQIGMRGQQIYMLSQLDEAAQADYST